MHYTIVICISISIILAVEARMVRNSTSLLTETDADGKNRGSPNIAESGVDLKEENTGLWGTKGIEVPESTLVDAVEKRIKRTASTNYALGKPAWQSTTKPDRHNVDATNAVDGDTRTTMRSNSCTHTGYDRAAWWAVDLGQRISVTGVRITNRVCRRCERRLGLFYIGVTDNSPSAVTPSLYPTNYNVCKSVPGVVRNGATVRFRCNRVTQGRYLIIQLRGTNYLSLCEVKVFGRRVTAVPATGRRDRQGAKEDDDDDDDEEEDDYDEYYDHP